MDVVFISTACTKKQEKAPQLYFQQLRDLRSNLNCQKQKPDIKKKTIAFSKIFGKTMSSYSYVWINGVRHDTIPVEVPPVGGDEQNLQNDNGAAEEEFQPNPIPVGGGEQNLQNDNGAAEEEFQPNPIPVPGARQGLYSFVFSGGIMQPTNEGVNPDAPLAVIGDAVPVPNHAEIPRNDIPAPNPAVGDSVAVSEIPRNDIPAANPAVGDANEGVNPDPPLAESRDEVPVPDHAEIPRNDIPAPNPAVGDRVAVSEIPRNDIPAVNPAVGDTNEGVNPDPPLAESGDAVPVPDHAEIQRNTILVDVPPVDDIQAQKPAVGDNAGGSLESLGRNKSSTRGRNRKRSHENNRVEVDDDELSKRYRFLLEQDTGDRKSRRERQLAALEGVMAEEKKRKQPEKRITRSNPTPDAPLITFFERMAEELSLTELEKNEMWVKHKEEKEEGLGGDERHTSNPK